MKYSKRKMETFASGVSEKGAMRPVYIRVPQSLWDDIHEVMAKTGLTMNAICLEALRPAVKNRLKKLISE
jgi:hypothetical protein